jgi:hypothetical protein
MSSNKFLTSRGASQDSTDGSLNLYGNSLRGANLLPTQTLKTDSLKRLVSAPLNISDVTGLQDALDTATNDWTRTGTLLTPKVTGDILGIDTIQSESGSGDISVTDNIDAGSNTIKIDNISESTLNNGMFFGVGALGAFDYKIGSLSQLTVYDGFVNDSPGSLGDSTFQILRTAQTNFAKLNLGDSSGARLFSLSYFDANNFKIASDGVGSYGDIMNFNWSTGLTTFKGDINMASQKTLDFQNENGDKIILDSNWKIDVNGGNLRIFNYTDTSDFVAFRWNGTDKLRITESGSDCQLTNPNGGIFIESVDVTGVNMSGVNSITFQDENNSDKLILKSNGNFKIGVVNKWMEFQMGPGENGYRFQIDNADIFQILMATETVQLKNGVGIDEFSSDTTLAGNSDLAVPTEKAVKTFINLPAIQNAGILDTSEFVLTDNFDGTIDMSGGNCYLRTSDSDSAPILLYTVSGQNNISLTDNSENYVCVDYNSGSPIFSVLTSGSTVRENENSIFEVYEVYRSGTTLTITPHHQKAHNIGGLTQRFLYDKFGNTRTDGLILSESADTNRYVEVSAGSIWIKLNKITFLAFNTSGTDRFQRYYYNGSNWVLQADQQTFDNLQYNNVASGLVTMTNNRYSFQEFYLLADSEIICVYGDAEYLTQSGSEQAGALTSLPDVIDGHSTYLGRIVFQKSATTASSVLNPFQDNLNFQAVTDHGNLGGLTDDDHTQYFNQTRLGNGTATSIQLSTGTSINEFSIDGTLIGNSDDALPTEKAVKTYVDNSVIASKWVQTGGEVYLASNPTDDLKIDKIIEYTGNNGVDIDELKIKNSTLFSNGLTSYINFASEDVIILAPTGKTISLYNNITNVLQISGSETTIVNDVKMPDVLTNIVTQEQDLVINSSGYLGYPSSLRHHKTNIKEINVDWLYQLNPISFQYKQRNEKKEWLENTHEEEICYGMIAEDVVKIQPNIAMFDNNKKLIGIKYKKLIPCLLKCIIEQKKEINELKKAMSYIEIIKSEMALLRKRLKLLES